MGDIPELYVLLGIVYRQAEQATEALRAFEALRKGASRLSRTPSDIPHWAARRPRWT